MGVHDPSSDADAEVQMVCGCVIHLKDYEKHSKEECVYAVCSRCGMVGDRGIDGLVHADVDACFKFKNDKLKAKEDEIKDLQRQLEKYHHRSQKRRRKEPKMYGEWVKEGEDVEEEA